MYPPLVGPPGGPSFASLPGHHFSLAPAHGGDPQAWARVAGSWAEDQARQVRDAAARAERLRDLRTRARQAFSQAVGADRWHHLMAYSRQSREEQRSRVRAFTGAERRELSRARRARSLELLQESGARAADLKALNRRFAVELHGLIPERRRAVSSLQRVPLDQVPAGVRNHPASPIRSGSVALDGSLTVFTPPFDGWWWRGTWWHDGGGDPQIDIYPDPTTGAVGHRAYWSDSDASDIDVFQLDYDTSVSVWYVPPSTGPLDVWLWVTCSVAHYDIRLEDEWGWSDSQSNLQSAFTANISPVIEDEVQTDSWSAEIDGNPDDQTFSEDKFPPGNVQTYHLTTNVAAVAGVPQLLRVGTHDTQFVYLNDVSTWQTVQNRWFVNVIFVRPA